VIDRLRPICDRLERADEHVETIKQELRMHFASNFHSLTGEYDAQLGRSHFQGRIGHPPIRLFTVIGEALHNYRSALDHLAWQLVESRGGTPDEPTKFPILRVPPTANRQGVHPPPHVHGGVSPTALALIEREQPYQLGPHYAHHPLFGLHHLNIVDKHRHIAVKSSTIEHIWFGTGGTTPSFKWVARTESADEYGAHVLLDPIDGNVNVKGHATISIVLHETGPGIDSGVLQLMVDIQSTVRRVVDEAAATCPELAQPF